MGLWLVQECRRAWEWQGKVYGYDELMRLAEGAPAVGSLGRTPTTIRSSSRPTCRRRWPTTAGGPARRPRTGAGACAAHLEGLAPCYRWVLERLERLTGKRLQMIHVVGGGSQNGC